MTPFAGSFEPAAGTGSPLFGPERDPARAIDRDLKRPADFHQGAQSSSCNLDAE
jgi:hypothetical protein